MAKKIRLDFSKIEERSNWNTKSIPEGLHAFKVDAVQETEAQDGTAMLVYALVPTDARYKTRRFPFYCKLQQNQLWKLRDLLVAGGVSVPKKAISIDPNSVVGKIVAGEVEDENGQYAGRSSINGIYGADILDEDGTAGEEPEDDEEYDDEYEESVEEADEEYEEDDTEEEYEDEEDDDLDEDDLGDEDLEDEELYEDDEEEDEEPEPAPAPRRRAPAKKPAAAAPKAAPAKGKRTVQRRR